ncbi:MAG TPA: cation transporter [Spirochaetia bacterium]|nr:cation transporter [Spirochaetia bacterium]
MREERAEMSQERLLRSAFALAIVTIVYNLIEGAVSTWFGAEDGTLALFGFGVDSFVEVVSGLGVAHMIYRRRKYGEENRGRFERTALRITGIGFYVLVAGIVVGAVSIVVTEHQPTTTVAGIVVSAVSIITMWILLRFKLSVGRSLGSPAVLSDAGCTRTCLLLSIVLLVSSLLYQLFHIPYVDLVGSLGIGWFAFREGKEALESARNSTS